MLGAGSVSQWRRCSSSVPQWPPCQQLGVDALASWVLGHGGGDGSQRPSGQVGGGSLPPARAVAL